MSKNRTSFEKFAFEAPDFTKMEPYDIAVLAWNARGKVDAEICRSVDNFANPMTANDVADAIGKEQA